MSAQSPGQDDVRLDVSALTWAVWARKWRILFFTLLILAATFAILQFVPKMYESSASILVEQRENSFVRPAGDTAQPQAVDNSTLMSSQVELIKSRDTLLKVVESADLATNPEFAGSQGGLSPSLLLGRLLGRDPQQPNGDLDEIALQNLYERLTVFRERDSRFITIQVRSLDPMLAARLANAIATAHVQRRTELSIEDTASASGWLETEIEKLRVRVSEAEAAVAAYRIQNDLFTGNNNTSLLDQQLSNISDQISAAQERRNTAQSRATLISGLLDQGQPVEGVPDVRASVVVQQLAEEKARLQGERAQRLATLLSNHPTVRAIDAQIVEVDRQIAQEGRRVAQALRSEAEIEAGIETSLREELTRTKISASTATNAGVTLAELEREAAAQRGLLETYLSRYRDAASRTDPNSALPDVRVVSLAAPAVSPASPRTTQILLAVLLIALTLQIGLILVRELMSGRAVVVRERVSYVDETHHEPVPQPVMAPVASVAQAEPDFVIAPDLEAEREVLKPEDDRLFLDDQGQSMLADAELDAATADARDQIMASAAPARPADRRASPAQSRKIELNNLTADLALGRVRVLMLASLGRNEDSVRISDRLVAETTRHGLSVVRVDAASGRPSVEAGLTDLAADQASFGDVVHKLGPNQSEVPWGQQRVLDRRSSKPVTLIEALSDIYEVVFVLAGRIGIASALPLFAGTAGRLVLVAEDDTSPALIEAALADAAALGFSQVQVVALPQSQPEVA